jgi:two-component system sensor histidine kinase/response regulator
MIVDDNPVNLRLLEEMLIQYGHEVQSFPRGRLALAAAVTEPPDLVLLDVNMPEMDGYQVCEQFKATRRISEIPIIFLSALNQTEDRVKGFSAGAADFISKPFQFEEVRARVETHLKLHRLQRELLLQNQQLESAVEARTHELAEANRRLNILDRAKSEFLNLISHEFRTPLNGILGVSEVILDTVPIDAENAQLRSMYEESRQRILSILDDAFLLTQIDLSGERFKSTAVSLKLLLRRAVEQAAKVASIRNVKVRVLNESDGVVVGDEILLERAFGALLATAIKLSMAGGVVNVLCGAPDRPSIIIEGIGVALPTAVLERFFDVFSFGEEKTPGVNLGLGPAVASRILSLFNSSVELESTEGRLRFIISLPQP